MKNQGLCDKCGKKDCEDKNKLRTEEGDVEVTIDSCTDFRKERITNERSNA